MRKLALATLALSSLPPLCSGQSGLSCTWRVDFQLVDWSRKPDVMPLVGGTCECKTREPPVSIKADGSDQ